MPRDLGNPAGGAGNNVAVSINNRGQVTVNSAMLDGSTHAFLSSDGVLKDLGTYPADSVATVAPCCNTINNRGQIVGFSVDSSFNQRAIFWEDQNTDPVDLNSLIPADSPWYVLSPGGINDAGAIAATAVNLNTFEIHAVLLSPVKGVGPDSRGATRPPDLPASVRQTVLKKIRQ